MIFEVAGSEAELDRINLNVVSRVIAELSRAHMQGNHLAVIPRNIVDWCLSTLELSGLERATLIKLRADYTQSAGVARVSRMKIVIAAGHRNGAGASRDAITIGFLDANRPNFFDRTSLLVEDTDSDGKLIMEILQGLRKYVGAPSLAFEPVHGGGQAIVSVWRQKIEDGRLVCMLTDSDRKSPKDTEPKKIADCKKIAADHNWLFSWAFCLCCHEIENIIPVSIIEQLQCAAEKKHQIDALRRIESHEQFSNISPNERFWLFYDLKNGVDTEKLEASASPDKATWTKAKIASGGHADYTGFGTSIVRLLLEDAAVLQQFMRVTRTESWRAIFADLFFFLIWLGFAPTRQIV